MDSNEQQKELTVLVVDDDKSVSQLIRLYLAQAGYRVISAWDGLEGLRMALEEEPDIILLDLNLPGMDGFEVCRNVRLKSDVPVIMVTAKGEEADIVTGLELGADDYVTKPFSPKVLIARVRTVLRRRLAEPAAENSIVRIHDLVITPGRHEALLAGKAVELTLTEFRILHLQIGRASCRERV